MVIDYKLPLALLREFLCLTHYDHDEDDVIDFFQRLLSGYFLERENSGSRYDLYEMVGNYADALEHSSRLPELVSAIFECIDEVTRFYMPQYTMMSAGADIEDCNSRGKSSVFVIELNRDFLR